MSERDLRAFPHPHGDVWVSDLQVLQSAAGFYLGRLCWSEECDGLVEPYSRETGYMTESAAKEALTSGQFAVRSCVENDLAYAQGLPHPQGKKPADFAKKVEEERARFERLAQQVDAD